MKSIIVLGRQPALGVAELESLLGPGPISRLSDYPDGDIALLDLDAVAVPFGRLGGSYKLMKVLNELPTTDAKQIETYLHNTIPEHLQYVPEGKFTLGLSFYGFAAMSPVKINAIGLRLKKTIKKTGRPVRIVPNKEPFLNAAQIIHNQLTGLNAWELNLVRNGDRTFLAQTTEVQDIENYAARDQGRPQRDAKVGMLPPKLAQIIVNLAADGMLPSGHTVLDPFCGTGVLLQEAALMGFDVYGTDLDPRMVEYSGGNLAWLKSRYNDRHFLTQVEVGDATTASWQKLDTVATELYLGQPLSKLPPADQLDKIVGQCDKLLGAFLRNLQHQTVPGQRLCLAVPAWSLAAPGKPGGKPEAFRHLSTLDHLKDLGYNRVSFVLVRTENLIYHRPGQTVARELVVLTRI